MNFAVPVLWRDLDLKHWHVLPVVFHHFGIFHFDAHQHKKVKQLKTKENKLSSCCNGMYFSFKTCHGFGLEALYFFRLSVRPSIPFFL